MTLKHKRRVLLAGSLAFFLLCLLLPGQWGKLVVLVVGALALLGFLYCNMGELTQVEEGSPKLGVLKQTVIFFRCAPCAGGGTGVAGSAEIGG